MSFFSKITPIYGLLPLLKYCPDPRITDPQAFDGPPQPNNPAFITDKDNNFLMKESIHSF